MNEAHTSLPARETPSPFADYFKEVIYGGIDGIVTTFAVVAGFSGAALATETKAQVSFLVVLLFGLANLFADGVSMGLGNFLSVRSEQDLYTAARAREERRMKEQAVSEQTKTVALLVERGFAEADAQTIATLYQKNPEYWVDFIMNNDLGLSDPRGESAALNGLATFGSFLVFGAIPLLPFMLTTEGNATTVFYYSVIGTFLGLVALGLLKWRVVGGKLYASLFEVVAVGSVAAAVAYFVGTFFTL